MYDLLGTVSDRYSALEFTLEHHAAAITTADLTRRADLSSASLLATGDRSRLRMEVHHPHGHRPGADRLVLARAWPHAPGHRTSRHCSRSDVGSAGGDPPF